MPDNDSRGFEPWEIEVVKTVVRSTARRIRALESETLDDLIQECLLHWWAVRGKLEHRGNDPPRAYLARVARN